MDFGTKLDDYAIYVVQSRASGWKCCSCNLIFAKHECKCFKRKQK